MNRPRHLYRGVWLLPGSITATGAVIDHRGLPVDEAPCFVPADLSPARKALLGHYGWCVCPARDWPSVLPKPNWRPCCGRCCRDRTGAAIRPLAMGLIVNGRASNAQGADASPIDYDHMAVFDSLPATLRDAINELPYKFSVRQIRDAWKASGLPAEIYAVRVREIARAEALKKGPI